MTKHFTTFHLEKVFGEDPEKIRRLLRKAEYGVGSGNRYSFSAEEFDAVIEAIKTQDPKLKIVDDEYASGTPYVPLADRKDATPAKPGRAPNKKTGASGQVALVTGSSRGIGLAAALALAREGFSVAVNGPANNDELATAAAKVENCGGRVFVAPFDVAAPDGHNLWLERIETELGPLTTLVNNAGVGVIHRGDPLDVTEDSWDRCHAINAKAMFFLTQTFVRRLLSRNRRGDLVHAIVNITSSNAVAVALPRVEYCVSKAAAAMVSKAWAVRLGPERIAVYDVQPGLISTDMTAQVIAQYEERAREGLTLIPRVGQPEEIGTIVASLASGRLPYTTGQVVSADAGLLVPRF